MTTLNIFDAYGKLRSDLDQEATAIEALPDDVREALFECIAAVKARDACEVRVYEAQHSVRNLEMVFRDALEADQGLVADDLAGTGYKAGRKANSVTHQSALAAVIAANAGRKIAPPKMDKKERAAHDAAEAALAIVRTARDEAETALAEARIVLQKATPELRDLDRVAGEKINAWRLCQTTPSAEEVTRQYLQRSQDERARIAAANPAEPNEKCELDKILGARGKSKTNRLPTYHAR
jgi:hypothetical protein